MWDWRGHSHNIILKGGSESVTGLHMGYEKDWVLDRKWEHYFFRSAWRKKLSKRRLKRSSQRNWPGIVEPCQRGQGREKKISWTVESTMLNSMKNLRAVNAETKWWHLVGRKSQVISLWINQTLSLKKIYNLSSEVGYFSSSHRGWLWQSLTLGKGKIGGGNGNPLQYACLEKPMDRGAWQATVHGVAKSQTQLRTKRQQKMVGIYFKKSV